MTNLRQYRKAVRSGMKSHVRRTKFIPLLLRHEYGPRPKRETQKRDIYLKRIGSGNFTRVEQRTYQRMQRLRERERLGHRVVQAIYGPNNRISM